MVNKKLFCTSSTITLGRCIKYYYQDCGYSSSSFDQKPGRDHGISYLDGSYSLSVPN